MSRLRKDGTPINPGHGFSSELIRQLSLDVYRQRLPDPDRQVKDDGDNGEKQAKRSEFYDQLTICYLKAIKRGNNEIT